MRRIVLTLVLLAALAARTTATVLVPADLAELARDARLVARGVVVRVDGQWTDDHRTIETIVTLDAERYLKGDAGSTLQFKVPGGTLGRFRNIILGAPQFSPGQHIVVFLGGNGPRVPWLLGLNQGLYRLTTNASGVEMVLPPSPMPGVSGPVVRGVADRKPAALSDFEQRVLALVGDGR